MTTTQPTRCKHCDNPIREIPVEQIPIDPRARTEQAWRSYLDGVRAEAGDRVWITDEGARYTCASASVWHEPADAPAAREEWVAALSAWANGDTEPDAHLVAALTALDEQDEATLWACILAAAERHGSAWTVAEFQAVVTSLAAIYSDGWAGVAEDYLGDHYPGFPSAWLKDLDVIGQDVKRDSEQYVLSNGTLYVFTRQ